MLTTYAAAACLALASLLLGQCVSALVGRDRAWPAAPAVGLALLMCASALGSRLPEGTVMVAALPALGMVAAVGVVIRRRPPFPPLPSFAAAGLALLLTAVPFYINGRSGLLGVSLNNDTATHLVWAEGMRSEWMTELYSRPPGYPLGPHSLLAATAVLTGIPMDQVLNGLMIATVAILAMAVWTLLAALPVALRIAGTGLVAFGYLPTAYYGQAAFKELLMALFVVAFVAVLAEVGRARRAWLEVGVPAGLLAAGGIQAYSHLGLGWFVGIAATWLALEFVLGRGGPMTRLRRAPRVLGPPLAAAFVMLVVGLASQADRLTSFARQLSVSPADAEVGIQRTVLGNLFGRLSPYEALGIWPSAEFREAPANGFPAGELAALALVVVLLGGLVALRRRESALVAGAAASLALWWISDRTQSPYVSAKALVIAAPLVMAVALGLWPGDRRGWSGTAIARVVIVGVFSLAAAHSTSLVMRAIPVASGLQASELNTLRHAVGRQPTLFLGADPHIAWRLRDVPIGSPLFRVETLPITASSREEKPMAIGQPLDFDSVDAETLDRFAYVITARSGYESQPPANFERVRSGRIFELWRRNGRTAPRETIEPNSAPGARLDCRRQTGRELRRVNGVAGVRPAPYNSEFVLRPVPPGGITDLELQLQPGRWMISVKYSSLLPVRVLARDRRWRLPASTGEIGPYYAIGEVEVSTPGPYGLRLIAEQSARITSRGWGLRLAGVSATQVGGAKQAPLSRACGRYIDWYRVTG